MYSLPFQVSSLIALCRLMVKWKRAELRHRAQLARDKQDWEKANRAVRATLNGCLLLLFLLVMNYNSYCWHTTWENRFGICTIVFSVVDVLWRGDVISMKSAQFANLAFMEQTQQASSQEKHKCYYVSAGSLLPWIDVYIHVLMDATRILRVPDETHLCTWNVYSFFSFLANRELLNRFLKRKKPRVPSNGQDVTTAM